MRVTTYDDVISRWVHPPVDEGWKDYAACQGTDPNLWFPAKPGERYYDPGVRARVARAKMICRECPVQRECLEWAVAVDERYGIYGGLTERQRQKLTNRRPE